MRHGAVDPHDRRAHVGGHEAVARHRSKNVTLEECERIAKALRRVLRRAIVRGGSSIDDFVNPDGSDGDYQSERKVYAREGEPCSVCRTPIRRTVIGQRSSHYCPTCQR